MDPNQTNTNNESAAGAEAAAAGSTAEAAKHDSQAATDAGAGEGQGEAGKTGGEGGEGAGGQGAEGEETQTPEVPEQYEVPEGFELSEQHKDFITGVAKASGMSQEQFNQGVTKWHELREAEKAFERGEWGAQSEQEFGKDFATIADGARRAIVFAEKERPGITDRLDKTNLGNHPDVLWLFNKLGLLSKAGQLEGLEHEAAGDGAKPDVRSVLYGNDVKK